MKRILIPTFLLAACAGICSAHDAWLQTNTNLVRLGDAMHIELLLGNHGNDHRDFKLAGKVDMQGASCEIVLPDGAKLDLKDQLVDIGYAPQEGFWTTRFVPGQEGLYTVGHLSDKVMSYGPVRSVKGAKACFVASAKLDQIEPATEGFARPLGHPLELVPLANPVTPMGPGVPIRVCLLYKGKPLPDTRVSFIPRGETLAEGVDEKYERTTGPEGEASFTPTFGTRYLVVAHRSEPNEKGAGYSQTKYSATLCVYVPQICACCNN